MNLDNRTIYIGDNLPVLRGINSASVDLVYLDPPFNSNEEYSAPIGGGAREVVFKDAFTLDDVDEAVVQRLVTDGEPPGYVIAAAGQAVGESTQAYLTYMWERLAELRRILKPDGGHLPALRRHRSRMAQGADGRRVRARPLLQRDHLETHLGAPRFPLLRAHRRSPAVLRRMRRERGRHHRAARSDLHRHLGGRRRRAWAISEVRSDGPPASRLARAASLGADSTPQPAAAAGRCREPTAAAPMPTGSPRR